MRKIYFVRHGESDANARQETQDAHSFLTDLGKSQAASVAERLLDVGINKIFSSSHRRTRETAEIIAAKLGQEIIYSDNLVERRMPTSLVGRSVRDEEANKVRAEMISRYCEPGWRYEDAEGWADLKSRAERAVAELEAAVPGEETILVVTHGTFLTVLVSMFMFDFNPSCEQSKSISHFFRSDNTGITVIDKRPGGWRLITWNDHAHIL